MARLNVFEQINNTDRISSVDIFRGLAIIAVVVYHFNDKLPYGFLGVDLFFVISGLLVGGLLTKELNKGVKINFFRFFLQRGFKIWPSYYAFFLVANILAYCFYYHINPDQYIPLWDLKRYLLFFQNYTGFPFHQSFDHVWSLCVEEHFYILLPLLFLFIQRVIPNKYKVKALFTFVALAIVAGIIFKPLSYYLTVGKDTICGTHNRIDALAWGVLLNLIVTYAGKKIKSVQFICITFALGLLIFISALYISMNQSVILFDKLYLPSLMPIAFFFMLLGLYNVNFSRLKPLRFIAYYSYNWYLWHPVFVILTLHYFGGQLTGLIAYLVITFSMAIIFTVLIEEPFLKMRKVVLDRIFKGKKMINEYTK